MFRIKLFKFRVLKILKYVKDLGRAQHPGKKTIKLKKPFDKVNLFQNVSKYI